MFLSVVCYATSLLRHVRVTCQTTLLHISEGNGPTHCEQISNFLNVIGIRYRRCNLVCILDINVCSNGMNPVWAITLQSYSLWTVIIARGHRILGQEAHFQTILSVRTCFKQPAIMRASYVSVTASVIAVSFRYSVTQWHLWGHLVTLQPEKNSAKIRGINREISCDPLGDAGLYIAPRL
jgi:hypothetical protein